MRSTRMAFAGAILMAGALLSTTPAQVAVDNGDMENGMITADGDTMPVGWGQEAVKNGVYMGYEMSEVHSGSGAMKLYDPDNTFNAGFWVGNFVNLGTNAGETVTLKGWYKMDQAGEFMIGMVRYCSGGGYCPLNPGSWKSVLRESGTTLGWVDFSYDVVLPDVAECEATCTDRLVPGITVHMHFSGPGSVLVDDLAVETQGGTRIAISEPMSLGTPCLADNRRVTFGGETSYSMTIHTADGRLVRTATGRSRTVDYFSTTPTAGTYVVQIVSDKGTINRTVAVSGN